MNRLCVDKNNKRRREKDEVSLSPQQQTGNWIQPDAAKNKNLFVHPTQQSGCATSVRHRNEARSTAVAVCRSLLDKTLPPRPSSPSCAVNQRASPHCSVPTTVPCLFWFPAFILRSLSLSLCVSVSCWYPICSTTTTRPTTHTYTHTESRLVRINLCGSVYKRLCVHAKKAEKRRRHKFHSNTQIISQKQESTSQRERRQYHVERVFS